MSLTGTGLEVRTRGGCFLGKKESRRFCNSDFHSGCSQLSLGSKRFSSGPPPAPSLRSRVAILEPEISSYTVNPSPFALTPKLDEHTAYQVASMAQILPRLNLSVCNRIARSTPQSFRCSDLENVT